MSEFVDEMSPVGGAAPRDRAGGQRAARGSITEDMTIGGTTSRPANGGPVDAEDVTIAPRGGRVLSASAQKMLANIDQHDSVNDSPPAAAEPAAPAPAVVTPPAAAAAAAPPPEPAPDHAARADRLAEHNRKLLGELEQLRARPARAEPSAREKSLDEAERGYHDDSIGALRRFVAAALGGVDPASKEVDAEMSGLYQDLTERELGVPLDAGEKAKREAIRTRRMLDRDRRDRAAPAPEAAAPDQADQVTKLITARITARGADGKTHADHFPLLTQFSEDFDGMPPERALWREIGRAIGAGEIDAKTADEPLIAHASRNLETRYQALADKIVKARTPAPSTAPPTQATDATASKADPASPGVRTITNASASVAPATPPAAKPAPTTEPTAPKYRNEKERRQALARKHFPDAT